MSKLSALKTVRRLALLPVVAAAFAGAALPAGPAQAQYYYRPYAPPAYVPAPPRYVRPAYPPPGAYYGRPVGRPYAPPVMPRADMRPMLGSMGLTNISRPRSDGQYYVSEATDAMGRRVQVRVNAYSGAVVSMRPIGPAVPPGSSRMPAPVVNVLPPKKPPLPPSPNAPLSASLPEAGASTPGGELRPAAPAPSAIPPVSPPSGGRAGTAPEARPSETKPAVAAVPPPATDPAPAEAAKPAEPGVRVIPGVAVPPNAMPEGHRPANASPATSATSSPAANAPATTPASSSAAAPKPNVLEARAGVSTGAGAGAAEVPAGTASVLAREVNEPPRLTPKPPAP